MCGGIATPGLLSGFFSRTLVELPQFSQYKGIEMTPSQVRNSETSELFKRMHLEPKRHRLIWNELISTLHSKLAGQLSIYGAWPAFVVFLLPSLNGFNLEKPSEGPL